MVFLRWAGVVMGEVLPFQRPVKAADPYAFDAGFEAAVVTLVVCRRKFYARVGVHLEADALAVPACKLLLEAAHAVARDLHHGPDSAFLVLQRLRRWMADGRVTQAQIEACSDVLDNAEDSGLPEEESVVTELVPVLRRRMEKEGIETALQQYMQKGDVTLGSRRLETAARLGESEDAQSDLFGPGTLVDLDRLKNTDRLSTGILELDEALRGGPLLGTMGVILAKSGGGKSMGLLQMAVAAAVRGEFAGIATLELPAAVIKARLVSNLTGIPLDAVNFNPLGCGALEKLGRLFASPSWGRVAIATFTPKVTSVADLLRWVKDEETKAGRQMRVLVVDYGDKLGKTVKPGKGSKDTEENGYQTQGDTYDALFAFARDERRWVWTGSQVTRDSSKGSKDKRVDMEDVADSMNKIRNVDTVITYNPSDDMTEGGWFVAKNRLGKPRGYAGPLPTDFDCARISPVILPMDVEALLR